MEMPKEVEKSQLNSEKKTWSWYLFDLIIDIFRTTLGIINIMRLVVVASVLIIVNFKSPLFETLMSLDGPLLTFFRSISNNLDYIRTIMPTITLSVFALDLLLSTPEMWRWLKKWWSNTGRKKSFTFTWREIVEAMDYYAIPTKYLSRITSVFLLCVAFIVPALSVPATLIMFGIILSELSVNLFYHLLKAWQAVRDYKKGGQVGKLHVFSTVRTFVDKAMVFVLGFAAIVPAIILIFNPALSFSILLVLAGVFAVYTLLSTISSLVEVMIGKLVAKQEGITIEQNDDVNNQLTDSYSVINDQTNIEKNEQETKESATDEVPFTLWNLLSTFIKNAKLLYSFITDGPVYGTKQPTTAVIRKDNENDLDDEFDINIAGEAYKPNNQSNKTEDKKENTEEQKKIVRK